MLDNNQYSGKLVGEKKEKKNRRKSKIPAGMCRVLCLLKW